MSNLSLFKPCVDWCVQSHMEFAYSGLWILYVGVLVGVVGYYLSKLPELPEKYLWVPEYLILLCIGLVCAFLVFNLYQADASAEKQVSHNIQVYMERVADDAVMLPPDAETDSEWEQFKRELEEKQT